MVLGAHVALCVTELDYLKISLPKKWTKNGIFCICWKISSLVFSDFGL